MRWLAAALLAAISLAHLPALAETGPLTPAPIPNRSSGSVTPAERAGGSDGGQRAAPFSGLPSSVESRDGGAVTPGITTGQGTGVLPSLSR